MTFANWICVCIFIHSMDFFFQIPLSGYGGRSQIEISDINTSSTGEKWIDFGLIHEGTSCIKKIFVTNRGQRCGFFKAVFNGLLMAFCVYNIQIINLKICISLFVSILNI